MVSYGSSDSPSLNKMNGNLGGNGRRRGGGLSSGFSFGNIVGDPFALASISIACLAWLITIISSIIAATRHNTPVPHFAWWAIPYVFFSIVGVIVVVGSDTVHKYQIAIVGFLAIGFTYTTALVDYLVYQADAAREAAAAGYILLSMVMIVWIFYFGSSDQASHRSYIDALALHKEQTRGSTRQSRRDSANHYHHAQPETSIRTNQQQPQMYTSAQLNGFETSSPVTGYPGGLAGQQNRSQPHFQSSIPRSNSPPGQTPSTANAPMGGLVSEQHHDPRNDVASPTEYPYRAKAIYSYEANPDDSNEISFTKHEILEVSDVSGRWWQAKKEDGSVGIAPSNYLILL